MSEHCSQDGGFIGKSGCTHPNHHHSELVKGLLAEKSPRMISAEDCDAALKEGFYVDSVNGKRIGFGSSLDRHLNGDHAVPYQYTFRSQHQLWERMVYFSSKSHSFPRTVARHKNT